MSIARYWNTIKYIKPIQFICRIRNRFTSKKQKHYKNVPHKNVDLFLDGLHNDEEYLKRFAYKDGVVEILKSDVYLDYNNISDLSPLIQFNLQYFEYAIVWAQKGYDFSFLKEKWLEYIRLNIPLQPYVISLQLINMIVAMNIYKVDDQDIYDELYSRYQWLLKHQEKHLLANHYFENLKAIVVASFVFGDDKTYNKYIKIFKKECQEEILPDGVHFELSMMYHKLILEDLIIVSRVCKENWAKEYIQKMLDAVYSIEYGFNTTPLFNDAGDNVAKSVSALVKTCKKEYDIDPVLKNSFKESGYFKIYYNDLSLLIDCGPVGPNYNPGHAHCDCLSFELFKRGKPLFVNSGTFQYQGDKRSFFRSTTAHNTITIDGQEQSDCWGEHRVAKRIKKATGCLNNNCFEGSFYTQSNKQHFRKIVLDNNTFKVVDKTPKIKDGLKVCSYLHLAPGFDFVDGVIRSKDESYQLNTIGCSVSAIDSLYSPEFGATYKDKCLVFEWKTDDKEHGYIVQLGNKEIEING